MEQTKDKYKIALLSICLNKPYHPYLPAMIGSARQFFLKNHEVDFLAWTDIPPETKIDAIVFPTEPCEWPLPTLFRYHLFLQQEEILRNYDYLFYCDADMLFVSRVGDEVLSDIVAARHPMYAVNKLFIPPYEPNKNSFSYIPRPGCVVDDGVKKRFDPLYAAGGFQGGSSGRFITAMKEMKEMIDKDFSKHNYIPIWNDETTWNAWLFKNPPTKTLSPSYVYPDSLNRTYYQKVWGRNYVPKIITITKPFTLTKEGGNNLSTTLPKI